MDQEPTLYIGKKAWYIRTCGVDKITKEVKLDGRLEDPQKRMNIADTFAGHFNLKRIK